MVEALWSEQGVGIVGGEPKCGKSFLALDLAVAAGVPSLRHFRPTGSGAVLLFAAEDAGHIVRARLQGIAKAAGARFEIRTMSGRCRGRPSTVHPDAVERAAPDDLRGTDEAVRAEAQASSPLPLPPRPSRTRLWSDRPKSPRLPPRP